MTELNPYYSSLGLSKVGKEYLNKQMIHNLYRKPKPDIGLNAPHFRVLKPGYVQQADLLFLPDDHGYKYVLVVVDAASKICDAEPLKDKSANAVLKAFKKIYSRKILSIPERLEVDNGKEFKKMVSRYFKNQGTYVRVAETGRHRQQAMVEKRNQLIQIPLWKNMISKEILTNEPNKEWVKYLPIVVDELNKKAKDIPKPKIPDHPVAQGNSKVLLDIGTKVRVQLDNPQDYVTGNRLQGRFRSVDFRWNPKIRVVKNILLMPGQPPLYQLDGDWTDEKVSRVAYTKNQLQVVPKNEERPPEGLITRTTPATKKKKATDTARAAMLNKKVSILWDNPKEWFEGTITKQLPKGMYEIKYDDGDVQKHRLLPSSQNKTWKLI